MKPGLAGPGLSGPNPVKEVVAVRFSKHFPVPFPEFKAMMEPMWSAMDEFFRFPFGWLESFPAVDVEETDDAYIVTAEVPGYGKEDIEVELQNNVLIIRGKKEQSEGRKFLRRERVWSSAEFQRMLQLPGPVNHSGVSAEFSKGELVITLPKEQRSRGFKIPLK